MARIHTYFTLLTLAFIPSGLSPTAMAQKPVAYTDSSQYSYQGCYRETTDIPNTNGARALDDGKSWVVPEFMTVPKCLGYCGGGSGEVYNYAGLEYSRECWCADHLNGLSVKVVDSDCDLQCDGNTTQLCGGRLRLSLYLLANSPILKHSTTIGDSLTKASDAVVKGNPKLRNSSTRMAVMNWMVLWGVMVMIFH